MNVQESFMVDKRMSCLVYSKKHSSKTPEKLRVAPMLGEGLLWRWDYRFQ